MRLPNRLLIVILVVGKHDSDSNALLDLRYGHVRLVLGLVTHCCGQMLLCPLVSLILKVIEVALRMGLP